VYRTILKGYDMRTIIAGSRGCTDINIVLNAIAESDFDITCIVSGTARGVDQLGEYAANILGIPIVQYPADWDYYGKSAEYTRNSLMANNADALIAIWDGVSKGTQHMITIARLKGLQTFIYRY
jgi:hypothetical protein